MIVICYMTIPKYAIVIGPTRVMRYVQIITVDRAAVQRSTVPVSITGQYYQQD